jgi:hypothetical protein
MASTLTVLAVSPHAVKYLLTSDGVNDVSRSRAQMIADTNPGGPLQQVLQGAATAALWQALPDSDKLSLYPSARTCSAGAAFTAGLAMEVQICGAGTATVEVRFIHSIGR